MLETVGEFRGRVSGKIEFTVEFENRVCFIEESFAVFGDHWGDFWGDTRGIGLRGFQMAHEDLFCVANVYRFDLGSDVVQKNFFC
jgi:hypothetical protein